MVGHTSSVFLWEWLSECVWERESKKMCVCVCVSTLHVHPLSEEYSERNPQIRASAARDLWDMYTHNLWLACSWVKRQKAKPGKTEMKNLKRCNKYLRRKIQMFRVSLNKCSQVAIIKGSQQATPFFSMLLNLSMNIVEVILHFLFCLSNSI